MRKSTIISLLALAAAVISLLIALAAYYNKRKSIFCDDFDDELLHGEDTDDIEYYSTDISDPIPGEDDLGPELDEE